MCPSIPAYCPLYKLIRYFIVLRTLCGTPWMMKKTTQVGIYGNSWATFKSKGSCARAEKLATITEPPSKTFIHQNLIIMYIHHIYIPYIYILCIVQPTNMLLKRLWSFFLSSCSSPLRKLTYRYQFQLGTPKNGWSSHVNPCKSPQKWTKNHQTISKF